MTEEQFERLILVLENLVEIGIEKNTLLQESVDLQQEASEVYKAGLTSTVQFQKAILEGK